MLELEQQRELKEVFTNLLRIDTSNPPGGERAAAEYIAQVLEKEGIPARLLEKAPGRTNVYAEIGQGSQPPVLLLSHIDVVPAPGPWASGQQLRMLFCNERHAVSAAKLLVGGCQKDDLPVQRYAAALEPDEAHDLHCRQMLCINRAPPPDLAAAADAVKRRMLPWAWGWHHVDVRQQQHRRLAPLSNL